MTQDKHLWYLSLALKWSECSACLRRHYGAVIIKANRQVSTGYNNPPIGCEHCRSCLRAELNIPRGTRYELCKSVHAEENALIFGDYWAMNGGTIYVAGTEADGALITQYTPCLGCTKAIINARIAAVVVYDGAPDKYAVLDPVAVYRGFKFDPNAPGY